MRELPTIKVLLAHHHQVVRDSLQHMLEGEKGIQVVGEAATSEEAIVKALALSPDVITMNHTTPRLDGIATARLIKRQMPRVAILMLTLDDEEDFVKRAIEAGASVCLLMDITRERLIKAVRDIYEAPNLTSPSINPALATESLKGKVDSRVMEEESAETPQPIPAEKMRVGQMNKSHGVFARFFRALFRIG